MVKISEMAVEKLKEIMSSQQNGENLMVRINFGGYGWGGAKLNLTLDELKNKNDVVVEYEGIKIIYNSSIKKYVKNTVIDYANNWFQRGFVIRGDMTSSC